MGSQTALQGIVGYLLAGRNLPAGVARHASEMFARTLLTFLSPLVTDGKLAIDWEDQVYAESVLTHDGAVRFGPAKEALGEGEAS